MLFFYIRHGDPIYNPDSLTPLGQRQAEALAKRLALYGLDEIYSSSSERAKLTAKPTCELLKKEAIELDWTKESYAYREFTVENEQKKEWIFANRESRRLFHSPEVRALGERWYEHPAFSQKDYGAGLARIARESDAFFASLGYEHIASTGSYRVTEPNDKRVALFAHQGFGLAFLSCLLDIPYPQIATHFDMGHTGMTVIEFRHGDGISIPRVCMLSGDSHLYREGLPTKYQNKIYF